MHEVAPHRGPGALRLTAIRAARALAPGLALALPPLHWVADATYRASLTTLGRDQGIFQYIAWAILQGQRDYRDVRDVNGPLTHLVHIVFLKLGGADEHRFRVLDLACTAFFFGLVGFFLPRAFATPRASGSVRPPPILERLSWALAAWVVLSGQYLAFVYWDLAQRESFFDWFMLGSVAMQLAAQARRSRRLLFAAGAFALVTWFGKPTFALFTAAQIFALAIERDPRFPLKQRLVWFAAGGALGAATQLAFLFAVGDSVAYFRIQFADVPAMYRFIWWRAANDVFSVPWYASQAIFGAVGAVVLLGLIALKELPRRVIVVALIPLCGVANVIAQGKGFPYHFHPVTAGVHLQWLVFAIWAWERFRAFPWRLRVVRFVPYVVTAIVALRVATDMEDSPHIKDVWILTRGVTAEQRESADYFSGFPEPDYFPFELRQTARYLQAHTNETDRVQVYGMDPYLGFLARRLGATPYIYAYDLNCDAALAGWTGGRPNEEQSAKIRAICDEHVRDFGARIASNPPAAFVFLDKSPLMTSNDAWADFRAHVPETARFVAEHYRETQAFGTQHVWLRNDIAE